MMVKSRHRVFALCLLLSSCSGDIDVIQKNNAKQTLLFKDWNFKSLTNDTTINLRSFVQGKKLVMVVYFAPWCDNWWNEMPTVARLYEKYKEQGFGVIGVSEYASIAEAQSFLVGVAYPIVVESESRNDRTATTHFEYRTATQDPRKWGSPWHVFINSQDISPKGEVLTQKVWTFSGELIEAEVEAFIQQELAETD